MGRTTDLGPWYADYTPQNDDAPAKPGRRLGPFARQAGRRARSALPGFSIRLQAVVHIELDRMRGHAETRDFFHLELDVRVDRVVREHVAGSQEVTIFVERFQA